MSSLMNESLIVATIKKIIKRFTTKHKENEITPAPIITKAHTSSLQEKEKVAITKTKTALLPYSFGDISQSIFSLLPFFIVFIGQLFFYQDHVTAGVFFVLLGWIVLFFQMFKNNNLSFIESIDEQIISPTMPPRRSFVIIAIISGIISFFAFSSETNNFFTTNGIIFWIISIVCLFLSDSSLPSAVLQCIACIKKPTITVNATTLLLLGFTVVGGIFRLYKLDILPADMWHDITANQHNVLEILKGNRLIYSEINTGAETLLFYIEAFFAQFFTPTFLFLKTIPALIGTLTIPFVYLFIKKVSNNTKAAIFGACFFAISHWPTQIARTGWRATLVPLFVCLVGYFFFEAIKSEKRIHFLLSGFFLGVGLYTYTSFRFLPILMLLLVCCLLFYRKPAFLKKNIGNFIAFFLMTCIVFIPMERYIAFNADFYVSRIADRAVTPSIPTASNPLQTLTTNIEKNLLMFTYKGDSISRANPPFAPQLDFITGVFFLIGLGFVLYQANSYVAFALLFFFFMSQAPSFFNLSFPDEVPSSVRSSLAIPIVFTFAGLGLSYFVDRFKKILTNSFLFGTFSFIVVGSVLFLSLQHNWNVYFVEYEKNLINGNYPLDRMLGKITDMASEETEVVLVASAFWEDIETMKASMEHPDKPIRPIFDNQIVDCSFEKSQNKQFENRLYLIKPIDEENSTLITQCYQNPVKQTFYDRNHVPIIVTYTVSLEKPLTQ